ncbi:hypothetical protein JM83_3651 [Gillisia sp. Hel_I_86]|uniref:GNAT family N-acetyltransferase n=1 Tax=Gillisia sp. Hel_I_86 TaxID=1249981 RepID=UPI00119BEFB4|nr:GNAT family N-acetyltransferase [Gillisia sp. Hel_I_86]TVZ28519.1 hypothetical protein JM83_3651 [Gillisia sp. Hel_I_86]
MNNIIYKSCTLEKELVNILELQNENHYSSLSAGEIVSQGFLTCTHSLELLRNLNDVAPHIIATSNNKVIAYLLTMTATAERDLPFLKPMFNEFRKIAYKDKTISGYNYLIVGQVCIAKGFRGQGILEENYHLYKTLYRDKFDFAITEIATRNERSLKAHKRIGFKEIHRYFSPEGEEWSIVILDW